MKYRQRNDREWYGCISVCEFYELDFGASTKFLDYRVYVPLGFAGAG